MLDISYLHALILANRPFLLSSLNELTTPTSPQSQKYRENVKECIDAAWTVVRKVHSQIQNGNMLQAFWFTQYVTFCALVVVYIDAIQQEIRHQASNEVAHTNSMNDTGGQMIEFAERNDFGLAEECQHHLATATKPHSLAIRYNVILGELRTEAVRQQEKTSRNIIQYSRPSRHQRQSFPPDQSLEGHQATEVLTVNNSVQVCPISLSNKQPYTAANYFVTNEHSNENELQSFWPSSQEGGSAPFISDSLPWTDILPPNALADILFWGQFDNIVGAPPRYDDFLHNY